MKLYSSFLTIQPNGTYVYLILRAPTKEALEQSHNSLFNHGATETKSPEYHSDGNLNSVATCLSSWSELQEYFYNVHHFKFGCHNKAYLHSLNQIGELKKEQNQEIFFKDDSYNKEKTHVFDGFNFGTIENSKPEEIKDLNNLNNLNNLNPKLLPWKKESGEPLENNGVSSDKKSIMDTITVMEL